MTEPQRVTLSVSDPVVIVEACRTPFGSLGGKLSRWSGPDLVVHLLTHLPPALKAAADSLTVGGVFLNGLGQAPARQCLQKAGWPDHISASLVSKVCGSGLYAPYISALTLASYESTVAIAGGMESMSQAPYLWPRLRKPIGEVVVADSLMKDGLTDFKTHQSMGELAEETARQFEITREAQEEFAISSAQAALRGYQEGFFAREIVPVKEFFQDEPLSKVNFDKMKGLPPVFGGTITAATASALADGAALVAMTRLSTAQAYGLTPLSFVRGFGFHAQSPQDFLSAPIGAIQKLLARVRWKIEDVDLFEINEAFALAPLRVMKALGIPREKVNPHGGACALGHPLGATGARLMVTITHSLRARKARRAVAALCIGGGEGMAVALESFF